MIGLFILAMVAAGGLAMIFHRANDRAMTAVIRNATGAPSPSTPARYTPSPGSALAPSRRFDVGGELLPALWEDKTPVIHIGRPQPEPEPEYHETRTARAAQTVETGVTVPLLQSVVTAGAVGVMVGLLAWALGWGWRVPVVCFALALALGWLWRLRLADSLLWAVETWTGKDLDNNQVIGNPGLSFTIANPAQARATVATETRQEAETAERAAMLAFVDACFTKGTAEGAHGIKASGPDRAEFVKRRDVLLSIGAARWRNPARPKAGWELAVSRQRARQLVEKHVL